MCLHVGMYMYMVVLWEVRGFRYLWAEVIGSDSPAMDAGNHTLYSSLTSVCIFKQFCLCAFVCMCVHPCADAHRDQKKTLDGLNLEFLTGKNHLVRKICFQVLLLFMNVQLFHQYLTQPAFSHWVCFVCFQISFMCACGSVFVLYVYSMILTFLPIHYLVVITHI